MYCPKCGVQNEDGANFCKKCGTSLNGFRDVRQPEMRSVNDKADFMGQSAVNNTSNVTRDRSVGVQQGMMWYKFIIYIQLFLLALSEVVNLCITFTGSKYGSYTDWIYLFSASLKRLDFVNGLVGLVIAVTAIYVRMQLAHFKRGATQKYLILLLVQIVRSIIYAIYLYAILKNVNLDTGTFIFSCWIQIVVLGCMLLINYIYFNKRQMHFVN